MLLCGKEGIEFLVKEFEWLERGSLGFTDLDSRTAVLATIQVSSPAAVPGVITLEVADEFFIACVLLLEELQAPPLFGLGL